MTGDQISAGIKGLTIETFDRVQPHIDRYAADERRQIKEGRGVDMATHISTITDLKNRYGFMDLRICRRASRLAVAKSIMAHPVTRMVLDDLEAPAYSGLDLSEDAGREGLRAQVGVTLGVQREYHPQGWTDTLGDPEFWVGHSYSPDVWGERHGIGLVANVILSGATIPGIERWRFAFSLSDRFDEPASQTKASVEIYKAEPGAAPEAGGDREAYRRTITHTATEADLEFVTGVFRQARDLRPVAEPIRQHLSYNRFLTDLLAEDKARAA